MSVRQGGNVIAGVAKGDKFPAGIIAPFAGTVIPAGWLLCDGSAISRTDYADLFAVIGTTYGAGDGNSTFNLPNLWERVPMGVWVGGSLGYMDDGQLPNIYGTVDTGVGHGHSSGAFYQSSTHQYAGLYANTNYVSGFDASRCSSAYSRSDNFVIPRRLNVNYIIKY